jgi:SPW repeat
MWPRIASFVLGVWLMVAPAALAYADPAARTSDRIVGPVVVGSAFVALWQLMRPLRWIGLTAGVWLLAAPWILGYGIVPTINSIIVGLLLAVLAFLGARTGRRFGGGWASLVKREVRGLR